MKRLAAIAAAVIGAATIAGTAAAHGARATVAAKCVYGCTVHVNGYTRRDGTYVSPYNRRPPSHY